MEMPRVVSCGATDCAYNTDNCCHAMAITVGDDVHPRCDTFCQSMMKGGEEDQVAGVGACKVYACAYNNELECSAPEICVGYKSQEADCLTFEPK